MTSREFETQAAENIHVSASHFFITLLSPFLCFVKGIGIFHDELSPTHETKARTDFIAVLGLNLIKTHRQIAITLQVLTHKITDHFFVGRAQTEILIGFIFKF